MVGRKKLKQVLEQIEERPSEVPLSTTADAFLEGAGLAGVVMSQLRPCSYAGPIEVGQLVFNELNRVGVENSSEMNGPCVEAGYLVIGQGLNGDPIAVNAQTGKVVFVSHDLLWEGDYEEIKECIVQTPLDLVEFWDQARRDLGFPVDSFACKRRWGG